MPYKKAGFDFLQKIKTGFFMATRLKAVKYECLATNLFEHKAGDKNTLWIRIATLALHTAGNKRQLPALSCQLVEFGTDQRIVRSNVLEVDTTQAEKIEKLRFVEVADLEIATVNVTLRAGAAIRALRRVLGNGHSFVAFYDA